VVHFALCLSRPWSKNVSAGDIYDYRQALAMSCLMGTLIATHNFALAQTGCQQVPDLTGVPEALLAISQAKSSCSKDEIEQLLREEKAKSGTSVVILGRCVRPDE